VSKKSTSNELAVKQDELIPVLQSSLYPGASINSIKMVLSYCQAAELDPMQKPVHIVPMWDSSAQQLRDVIMPGIGLYRIQAARSGEYGGISEPVFGPEVSSSIGGAEITYPAWCKITVCRLVSGHKMEFSATERWLENYAVRGGKQKSIAPNAMWSRRPFAQLAKCAEAQALRKAFPEFGSAPTAEEMEDKVIEGSFHPDEPSHYPQDQFETNFPLWGKQIANGKKTPDQIVDYLNKKNANLSEEQIEKIKNIGVNNEDT